MKLAKFLFLLLIAFNLNILSQKKDAPIDVRVNVLVTDANGKPIDDVKQEEIKIFEDGVEQKITSFAKKEPILNVGLIVDNTGSMRTQLEQLIWTGKMLTLNLSGNDNAFVVRFVSANKIQTIQDWISPQSSQQNQAKMQTVLDNLFVEGGQSAVIDAIHFSAKKMIERQNQNKSQRYVLVLISDGEDRDSFYKESQLYELLKESEVEFYSIAFIGGFKGTGWVGKSPIERVKKFLNNLSNETGGMSYFLEKENPTEEQTKPALKAIMFELRSQYVISYTSTNQNRDGKPRKLTVQISDNEKGEKRQAFVREGFTVPKN